MTGKITTVAIGLMLALALAACTESGSNESTTASGASNTGSAATGDTAAPTPALKTWGNAPDIKYSTFAGTDHKLSEHLGKPLVVNFWAAWCGPCVKEMPEFNKVYSEMAGAFELVAIAVDERNDPRTFFSTKQFGYVGAFGDAGVRQYVDSSIPVTAFIDRNGNLVHKQTGGMSIETFREHLAKIL